MNNAEDKVADEQEQPSVKEVRGLTRGLMLLKALNGMPDGCASTSALARSCGIHRSTARRLLETLRSQRVVALGEREGQYRVTSGARLLSDGYVDDQWLIQVAGPSLRKAAPRLVWPVNVATAQAGYMVIRESTRRVSPLSQQHALLGERVPMLLSALGRAYLAACDDETLYALLRDLESRSSSLGIGRAELSTIHDILEETRSRGYAVSANSCQARFSAVAVPLRCGERVLGALNIVFAKESQSTAQIEERYLPLLKELGERIGMSSMAWVK